MPEYIKTKSNYVYRSEHQKTPNGVIYERNYMTVSLPDGYSKDMTPVYGDSNFVFVTRSGVNVRKKRRLGTWINNGCGNEFWTPICLGENISRETKIVFNPDYSSLKDFAYYGSAINLIRATINGVIMYFPAELYFSDEEYKVGSSTYYRVYNDFNIDVNTKRITNEEVENELRYMCLSSDRYCVIDGNGNVTVETLSWSVENGDSSCSELSNGTFIATATTDVARILVYYKDGEKILLTTQNKNGYKIRPKESEIEKYYDNIDDFTRVLLNRDSYPIYKAVFMTPRLTEGGYVQSYQTYIWPTRGGYNPDITSQSYGLYVNALIKLATYHDEYDCDNLWRMMTHEAIKNLDWTFTKQVGTDVDTIEEIDTSRIEPILKIYGRQYDDIKRYIDTIRTLNNITYDKKNNFPDYFLTDSLSISGWDVKSVNPTIDETVVAPSLYSGITTDFDSTEANIEFARRLKLNTRYLHSVKGTRKGIEAMLGLLGYNKDEDYTITEHDCVFSGEYPTMEEVQSYNILKSNYPLDDYVGPELYGLPLREVLITDESGETELDYVIPWYDEEKPYDDELYFQMYGGWRLINEETIDVKELTDATAITSDAEYSLYGQTQNSIHFCETLDEMLELGKAVIRTGDICYVENINNISDLYMQKEDEPQDESDFSNYFIIMDADYCSTLGFYQDLDDDEEGGDGDGGEDGGDDEDDGDGDENTNNISGMFSETRHLLGARGDARNAEDGVWGWKNVGIAELSSATTANARKVLHLESIIDTNEGNNPHFEEGHSYDNGDFYIERMANPFKGAIDAGYMDELDEETITAATATCKFTPTTVIDNTKCWYFTDSKLSPQIIIVKTNDRGDYVTAGTMTPLSVDIDGIYNPEGGQTNDEAAANSVVNIKNMELKFKNIDTSNPDVVNFIIKKVLFYVEQMIPSTTILSVILSDE